MRVGKRLFPYPVINNQESLSGFNNSIFSFDYDLEQKENQLILKNLYYDTNNENLEVLIEKGLVRVDCIIECSATLYRERVKLSRSFNSHVIPIFNLKGKVVISAYAYALEDIKGYYDRDFLDDYGDYKFDIEKYDILACDDGYTTKIKYDEKQDNKVSSIFLVLKNYSSNSERIIINETDEKIIIKLPERQFDIYDKMKYNPHLENIFFSMLIIPSLSYVLEKIKRNNIEDLRLEYNWFVSIEKQYKQIYSNELTNDILKNISGIDLSQILMNDPVSKGIDELFYLSMNNTMGDDELE